MSLISLVGFPPSAGFFAKIGLVQASASAGAWQAWTFITVIIVAAIGSLIAMQKLWSGVFWGPQMENYRPDSPGRAAGGGCHCPRMSRFHSTLRHPARS
ncbi:hypothetical protein [Ornithinimicrobium sp. INDO-MA30-4]|uniref:hypothetical protein n=1 Tax=Ornithinimicrobium sp. INDO-MA30-4 TaxID=2908651 RepID=UPI00288344F7|nr:hypothetical protein [Ornithinimicrobium sp. INDO-MA30-4]